jgi:hypothetical protein
VVADGTIRTCGISVRDLRLPLRRGLKRSRVDIDTPVRGAEARVSTRL